MDFIKINRLLFLIYLTFISCKTLNLKVGPIDVGKDPNFNIVPNNDIGLSSFNKKVIVFGIDLYAVREVEDAKLLHAANVMAQYLDNDEDGLIDNQMVLNKMLGNKAFLVIWKKKKDLKIRPSSGRIS